MNNTDIKRIVRLTLEWLEFLDIYKIEGCTEQDIVYALKTGRKPGAALLARLELLPRKEWLAVMDQVIPAVNAKLDAGL